MGIDSTNLPDVSPAITYAFGIALVVVNRALCAVSPYIYKLAVYNLAGDNLINWAPDVNGQDYFQKLREEQKIANFQAGVVSATTDSSTSVSLEMMEAAKGFTMANLQNIKTPYGRQYLAFAQEYGPSIWGLTR